MRDHEPSLAKRRILGRQAPRDKFVRQAMKTVAQDALLKKPWRQRKTGGGMALRAVKGRIETGDLRDTRKMPRCCFNAGEIMRLMQGRQRHQRAELCQDGIGDHHRRAQIPPAMHHAMTDGANGRAIQQGRECGQNHPKRAFMALGCLRLREAPFRQHRPRSIAQDEMRRGANAFHLAIVALRQGPASHAKHCKFQRG